MNREYVDSTMIASEGYDAQNSILEIEFKSTGAVWQYLNVPESLYFEFKNSASKGIFFNKNILGQYPEIRVG